MSIERNGSKYHHGSCPPLLHHNRFKNKSRRRTRRCQILGRRRVSACIRGVTAGQAWTSVPSPARGKSTKGKVPGAARLVLTDLSLWTRPTGLSPLSATIGEGWTLRCVRVLCCCFGSCRCLTRRISTRKTTSSRRRHFPRLLLTPDQRHYAPMRQCDILVKLIVDVNLHYVYD